jgi:hypothetical protein
MTRSEKIAKASELRRQGLTYDSIGKRFGVSGTAVYRWLNPDWAREQDRKDAANPERKRGKRQWEKDNRAECPQCGGQLQAGSRCPSRRSTVCAQCVSDNRRAKIVRFIGLRREGLTNAEIERRDELPYNAVATLLCEAKKEGFDVPPPPYWTRGSEQVAA